MELVTRHDPPGRPGDQPQNGGGGGADLDQAITVLRARIDEEFRVTERLDSKARQAFALAAGFFAVVQTVAFGGFAERTVNGDEKVALLLAAVVAGVLLVRVALRLANSEELLEEADVKPQAIVKWCNEAGNDREYVPVRLVTELARMADTRAKNNATRSGRYDQAAAATRLALIFAGMELLTAIVVRL